MRPELTTIKISKPAHRALQGAGIETLEHLTQWSEDELLSLHGFGAKGLGILISILSEYGLSLKT